MSYAEAPRLSPHISAEEFKAWKPILCNGERRMWKSREVLYHAGAKSAGLHLCLSGAYTAVAYGKNGQMRCLWVMKENSIIGEIAMFTSECAIYNMECQSPGETVFFPKNLLLNQILPENPLVARSLMHLLARKLRMQSADVLACNFIPAKMRLAIFLLQIFHEYGNPIRFCHTDLADYLGLHRVTVTNALSFFRGKGLVDTNQREIEILDPRKLEEYVEDVFAYPAIKDDLCGY